MTREEINALPERVRKYIHDVETNCDPAGIIAENALLRDQVLMLESRLNELEPCPAMVRCPSCHGDGTWETECCDGSHGCSCRGERIPMGTCNVCGGSGQVEEGNCNPRANVEFIRSNFSSGFIGTGRRR